MFAKKNFSFDNPAADAPPFRFQIEEVRATHPVHHVGEIFTDVCIRMGNREYQQDAVYVSPGGTQSEAGTNRFMGLVCDGMGGMADGGRASRTAVQILSQAFEKIRNTQDVNIPAFFRQGILTTDQVIHDFPQENGRGSGTTMVGVVVEGQQFYWASVGDSRIYFLHDRQLIRLTRDHNYDLRLRQMVAEGTLTRAEYEGKTQKEALISFLGIGNVSLMDVAREPIALSSGDIILLCSDGVTKTLRDDRIFEILVSDRIPMENRARQLVEVAIHGNTKSQDNTSVVLMQYKETLQERSF